MTDNFRIFKTVSRTDCIIEPFYFVSQSFLILAIIFSRNPTGYSAVSLRTAFMQWFFKDVLGSGYAGVRLRRTTALSLGSNYAVRITYRFIKQTQCIIN